MEQDKKSMSFDVKINELKTLNPNLSLAKCRICYKDLNRNGSYITQECIDDMVKQLPYVPVVGEWKGDHFGDHGGRLEITNNEINYIDTTIAYGCAMDTPIWYEDIIEEDGQIHSYVCTNLVLFTGKYPELYKVIEDGSWQSMEIMVIESNEQDNITYINKAVFSALCILGRDDLDESKNSEPCFESSTIEVQKEQVYSLLKEEIRKNFSLTFSEINNSLKKETKGGLNMELENKEEVVIEENKQQSTEFATAEENEDPKEETTETPEEEVKEEDMSCGDKEKMSEVEVEVEVEDGDCEDGEPVEEESTEEEVPMMSSLKAKLEEKDDLILALNEKYSNLEKTISEKDELIASLQKDLGEYASKERKEKVENVFSKFAKHLSKEEIESFREKEVTFSKFEEFEKEIKSFVCDKIADTVSNKETENFTKRALVNNVIEEKEENKSESVWDRLASK